MASFKIDTTKIYNCSENINELAGKYEKNINDMFDSLRTLPTKGIWIGTEGNSSVYTFLEKVMKEKDQYNSAIKYMYNYGNLLKNFAKNLENIANNKIGGNS